MESEPLDERLRDALRVSWTPPVGASPRFRAEVWSRIEERRARPSSWFAWLRLHLLPVSTAALASVLMAVAGAGWLAEREVRHSRERLVSNYVASIDPHQVVAGDARP